MGDRICIMVVKDKSVSNNKRRIKMGEWKQDSMPKRMQQSIKATRDKLKQAQREEIKKSTPVADPITKEQLVTPVKPKVRSTKPKLPKPFMERVAPIQTHAFPSRPVLTHKRRRWLHKHPGVPTNQYPGMAVEERRSA
jgi:hypothetical protein